MRRAQREGTRGRGRRRMRCRVRRQRDRVVRRRRRIVAAGERNAARGAWRRAADIIALFGSSKVLCRNLWPKVELGVVGAPQPSAHDLAEGILATDEAREELALTMHHDLDGVRKDKILCSSHGGHVAQRDCFEFLVAEDVGVEANVLREDVHPPLQQDALLQRAHEVVDEFLVQRQPESATHLLEAPQPPGGGRAARGAYRLRAPRWGQRTWVVAQRQARDHTGDLVIRERNALGGRWSRAKRPARQLG